MSKMKIYTCCPHSACRAYQDALEFLRRFGIEPTIGIDNAGHYLEVRLPKKRTKRAEFLRELNAKVELR